MSFSQSFGATFPKDESLDIRGGGGVDIEGGAGGARGGGGRREVEMIVGLEDVFNEGGFSLASLDNNSSKKQPT